MGIEIDTRGFNKELKKAAEQAANEGMRDSARALQREVDAVSRTHSGTSIDKVKPALEEAFKRAGHPIDSEVLTEWATAISQGDRIDIKPERVKL